MKLFFVVIIFSFLFLAIFGPNLALAGEQSDFSWLNDLKVLAGKIFSFLRKIWQELSYFWQSRLLPCLKRLMGSKWSIFEREFKKEIKEMWQDLKINILKPFSPWRK